MDASQIYQAVLSACDILGIQNLKVSAKTVRKAFINKTSKQISRHTFQRLLSSRDILISVIKTKGFYAWFSESLKTQNPKEDLLPPVFKDVNDKTEATSFIKRYKRDVALEYKQLHTHPVMYKTFFQSRYSFASSITAFVITGILITISTVAIRWVFFNLMHTLMSFALFNFSGSFVPRLVFHSFVVVLFPLAFYAGIKMYIFFAQFHLGRSFSSKHIWEYFTGGAVSGFLMWFFLFFTVMIFNKFNYTPLLVEAVSHNFAKTCLISFSGGTTLILFWIYYPIYMLVCVCLIKGFKPVCAHAKKIDLGINTPGDAKGFLKGCELFLKKKLK